ADRISRTILSHTIIMPLLHVQEERQHDEPDAPDDGHEDAEQQLTSEGETNPGFPREEAELVEGRLTAGAPPLAGQLLTWDTVRWPDDPINTVGAFDVDAMDDKGLRYIDCIATLLDLGSRRSWRAAQRASAESWRQWVRTKGQNSAGALHRWTTPPVQWQPQATAADPVARPSAGGRPSVSNIPNSAQIGALQTGVHGKAQVPLAGAAGNGSSAAAELSAALDDHELAIWGDELDEQAPWMQTPSDLELEEYRPTPVTPQQVLESGGRFRPKTGLGESDWHPRLWQRGGHPGAARVASVLNAAAGAGAARRAYDWTAKGRSSERAASVQALFCEAAVAQDLEYAVTYFYLVKCFEYVTQGSTEASTARWGSGIVAGSRFAHFCLKMVMLMELNGVVTAFPWADTCLFFDDLAVATKGLKEFAQYWHPLLLQALIDMFEATLDMVVSQGEQGKTVAMASTTPLHDEFTRRIRALGARMAKEKKHLGATGQRGDVAGRAGGPAAKIVRQAKVPSLHCGVQVMGVADTKLGELRQSVATSLQGNTKGRSTFLALLADDVDPGALANSAPILAWAQAWRETDSQPELTPELQAAWKRCVLRVGRVKSPWQLVRGPAGAFVATVRRLGWMTQAAHSITIGAEVLDSRVAPLRASQHYVKGANEQGLKDAWLVKWGDKLGLQSVFVEPARALLRRPLRGRLTQAHQTRVCTLRRGGTWPQLHLFQKGAAENDTCQACRGARGTDRHRTFERPAREGHRREVQGHHIMQRGANPRTGTEQLWGRGSANDPAVEFGLWGLPSMDAFLVHGESDGCVTGDVYTDGSLLYGSSAALRRGGWSFVQLAPDMKLRFACYGPQPGAHPAWGAMAAGDFPK
ncbi:unnamed protein product, partial [Prorocentrum cordatum]